MNKTNNFIAIKSKATILKVLDNEMKKAHKYPITVVDKEYNKGWKSGWTSALQHIKNEVEKKCTQ